MGGEVKCMGENLNALKKWNDKKVKEEGMLKTSKGGMWKMTITYVGVSYEHICKAILHIYAWYMRDEEVYVYVYV